MPFQAIKTTVQQSYKRLNQHLASFVPRKEQNYLVAEIVKVLSGQYGVGKRILVAEAGTGIGKSLVSPGRTRPPRGEIGDAGVDGPNPPAVPTNQKRRRSRDAVIIFWCPRADSNRRHPL